MKVRRIIPNVCAIFKITNLKKINEMTRNQREKVCDRNVLAQCCNLAHFHTPLVPHYEKRVLQILQICFKEFQNNCFRIN
jgi:hypothetical protein